MRLGRRRISPLTALLGGGLVSAAVLAGLSVGTPSASSVRERTVTVASGVVQSTVSGSGNLSPLRERDLSFGASGQVTHIYVKAGDKVKKGQLLATIDPSSAEVDLAEAKAQLQSAEDTLSDVESSNSNASTSASATTVAVAATVSGTTGATGATGPQKTTTTTQQTTATPSQQSQSTTSLASAEAGVKSAQLSVKNAEKALSQTKLRAPMSGTIAAVNGEVGDTVGSSSSNSSSSSSSSPSVQGALGSNSSSSSSSSSSGFITLMQIHRFKMDVSLTESDIGSVKVGQPATVTVNAASGEEFAAKVTDIGVQSSSSSSSSSSSAVSYSVTLTLEQSSTHLKEGMSASAEIVTAQASGLTVPTQALTGNRVTLIRDGKRFTQQVQTGVAGDSTTQIVSGLKAGDQVVVRSSTATSSSSSSSQSQSQSGNSRTGLGGGAFPAGGGAFPGGGPPGGGFGGR